MISSMASISQSSASVRVDKATSEFLIGPDWALNMDICDMINSNNMLAKDVVKAVKKRLQHKNPKVQLLALTLLEMMVKNCGDYVHFQIAERDVLPEMIKIVRKRSFQTDLQVRDKVLTLIDSWNEALGGASNGRYPQYRMAYEDLRRSGVNFPQRSPDASLIFTPPIVHQAPRYPQPGYGMPSSSTTRLDEAMAADANMSLFTITTMREVLDLLADMLRAVDSKDRSSIKDEVIADLVTQCRDNQKKLMKCLETTGDEELLKQGLELNDLFQNVLVKHDAIASGTPLPPEITTETSKEKHEAHAEVNLPSVACENPTNSLAIVPTNIDLTDDEEEDDFAKLARRHSTTGNNSLPTTEKSDAPSSNNFQSHGISNALAPVDHPTETIHSKDQDIMDLLSLTLTTTTSSSTSTPHDTNHFPTSEINFSSEAYPGHPGFAYNTYVAPWAHPQPWQTFSSTPQPHPQAQVQAEQQEFQTPYPPPPWAPTPGYPTNHSSRQPVSASASASASSGVNNIEEREVSSSPRLHQNGQKPFIPSYKLFDDLDVFGNTGGRLKATTNSILGSSNNNLVGGRK